MYERREGDEYSWETKQSRYKFVPYLVIHNQRTETGVGVNVTNRSSCIVQAQWEWNDSAFNGRWGREFQAYRYRMNMDAASLSETYAYSVITTRNKLRGKGRALSLKFSTEPFRDLQLLGWSLETRQAQEP